MDGEWAGAQTPLPAVVTDLLGLAGEIYLPFLEANAAAARAGAATVELRLNDFEYSQPVFRYQTKCLEWLREEFQSLPPEARERIRPALETSGCWRYLASG